MTATDQEQIHRAAIVAAIEASATVQGLCGRSTEIVVERGAWRPDSQPLPAIAYDLEEFDAAGQSALLRLAALTDLSGNGYEDARELLAAAIGALTYDALAAHGVEVCPGSDRRTSVDPLAVQHEGQPQLVQADAVLPLTLFTD